MTAPAYRSISAVATGTTSCTVSKPAGTVSGDALLLFVAYDPAGSAPSTPSGWTASSSSVSNSTGPRCALFYRDADGTEGASWSVSGMTSASWCYGVAACFQSGRWHSAANTAATDSLSTQLTLTTSPGTPVNDCTWVAFGAYAPAPGSVALGSGGESPSLAATERLDSAQASATLAVWSYSQTTAGSMGRNLVTVPSASARWAATAAFLWAGNTAPSAPVITTPASGDYVDATDGVTMAWTFTDSDYGDAQGSWAVRRKTTGAYSYWNEAGGTWDASEVENPGATASKTWTSGWANGSTYYASAKTWDDSGTATDAGSYASDVTIVCNAKPTVTVTDPTGTVTATTRPTVAWSYSDVEANAQQAYLVRVFEEPGAGWGGFDPDTDSADAAYDSGWVTSAGTSQAPDVDLANSTDCRAYVRVEQTGNLRSAWDYEGFTVSVTAPPQPSVSVAWASATARATVTVTQGASPDTDYVKVERSDDGGTTWVTVRDADVGDVAITTSVDVVDYEAPLNTACQWRATPYRLVSSSYIAGTVSAADSETTTVSASGWLTDPADHDLDVSIALNHAARVNVSRDERQAVYRAFGRSTPVVVSDVVGSESIACSIQVHSAADRVAVQTILDTGRTLLLRLHDGRSWWVRPSPTVAQADQSGLGTFWLFPVTFVEVDSP